MVFPLYQYRASSLQEQGLFFEQYVASLSARYDDFYEAHILNSAIYSIWIHGVHSGYFGIHEETLLTQFYITKEAFKHAQKIFKDILVQFKVKSAFVPTCDEMFLSMCLDQHRKVNLQAYFFELSGKSVRPPEYPRELLRLATVDNLEDIVNLTGDFLDQPAEMIRKGQIYTLRDQGDLLGIGMIVDNVIMKNCKGTGMFTNENYRQKGVGRSIILHLRDICLENGITPIPGCWYYNHNSKRTLESAGYISKTRLLHIEF